MGGLGAALAVHGPGVTPGAAEAVTIVAPTRGGPLSVVPAGETALWLPLLSTATQAYPGERSFTFGLHTRVGAEARIALSPIRVRYRYRAEDIATLVALAGSRDAAAWDAAAEAIAAPVIVQGLGQLGDASALVKDGAATMAEIDRQVRRALVRAGFRVSEIDWPSIEAPGGVGEGLSALASLALEAGGLSHRAQAARQLHDARAEAVQAGRAARRAQQLVDQQAAFEAEHRAQLLAGEAATLHDAARLEAAQREVAVARALSAAIAEAADAEAEGALARVAALSVDGERVVRLEAARRAARRRTMADACPVGAAQRPTPASTGSAPIATSGAPTAPSPSSDPPHPGPGSAAAVVSPKGKAPAAEVAEEAAPTAPARPSPPASPPPPASPELAPKPAGLPPAPGAALEAP